MKLITIEWFDAPPFVVEVKDRSGARYQPNVERKHHVKLDIDILNHRPPGRLVGLHWDRGDSGVDRQGALRAFSRALPGDADPGREESPNQTKLNKESTMKF